MTPHDEEMTPGMAVTWHHELRGGYGYVERIPGRLLELRGERAYIEVTTRDGKPVRRWVKRENVQRREP